MAGTKETPRQKMIGMMYLVLTALLALQVTSAILEKFVLLNNSLEQSTGAANKVNQYTFEIFGLRLKSPVTGLLIWLLLNRPMKFGRKRLMLLAKLMS